MTVAGMYTFGVLETKDNGMTWTNGPTKDPDSLVTQAQVKAN